MFGAGLWSKPANMPVVWEIHPEREPASLPGGNGVVGRTVHLVGIDLDSASCAEATLRPTGESNVVVSFPYCTERGCGTSLPQMRSAKFAPTGFALGSVFRGFISVVKQ